MKNKQDILDTLLPALRMTKNGKSIVELSLGKRYEPEDTAIIVYSNGMRTINLKDNTAITMIREICNAI